MHRIEWRHNTATSLWRSKRHEDYFTMFSSRALCRCLPDCCAIGLFGCSMFSCCWDVALQCIFWYWLTWLNWLQLAFTSVQTRTSRRPTLTFTWIAICIALHSLLCFFSHLFSVVCVIWFLQWDERLLMLINFSMTHLF